MFKEVLAKVKEERDNLNELIRNSGNSKEMGLLHNKKIKLDKVEREIREYLSMK